MHELMLFSSSKCTLSIADVQFLYYTELAHTMLICCSYTIYAYGTQ